MGIIDDYYGGYENLALFTDPETGEVDFEAAYDAQLPDDDGYYDYTLDPFERAIEYKFKQALAECALPGWTDTGRTTQTGKPIWEGNCTSCNQHTTVPFLPLRDGNPPMCKQCWSESQGGRSSRRGRGRGRGAGGGQRGAADAAGGASSSRAAEEGAAAAAAASGAGPSQEHGQHDDTQPDKDKFLGCRGTKGASAFKLQF